MKKIIKQLLGLFGYNITKKSDLDLIQKNYNYLIFAEISAYFNNHNYDYFKTSKSQICQDYFVASYFNFKSNGIFIEFGATDGIKDSNTYSLEKQLNWSGVLVEPIKSFYTKLKENRDAICLNNVLYNTSGNNIPFIESKTKELSTIKGYEMLDKHNRDLNNSLIYDIETISLQDIIEKHLPHKEIDYLSIDTEGSEYQILKNIDFNVYNFKIITVEHNYTKNRQKIYKLLTSFGYERILSNISRWDDYYISNS